MPGERLNRTRGSQLCHSFFSLIRRTPFVRGPVRQQTCRTHDATAREGSKATTNIQVVSITNIFIHQSVAYPWRGTCLTVPSLAYRTICIVLLSLQYFLNKQCIAFCLLLHSFFIYICSLMTCCIRTLWYGQIHQGLKFPKIWCDKSEYFHKCGTSNL